MFVTANGLCMFLRFDLAIQAYENQASVETDSRILKQLHEYDQRIEELVHTLHTATGLDSDMRGSKTGNLVRKEKRLLALLSELLIDIDSILQQDTGGDATPEPQVTALLPEIDEIPDPANGGNTGGPGSASVIVLNDVPAQVPEPSMPALLFLGFMTLLLPRLKRRR